MMRAYLLSLLESSWWLQDCSRLDLAVAMVRVRSARLTSLNLSSTAHEQDGTVASRSHYVLPSNAVHIAFDRRLTPLEKSRRVKLNASWSNLPSVASQILPQSPSPTPNSS